MKLIKLLTVSFIFASFIVQSANCATLRYVSPADPTKTQSLKDTNKEDSIIYVKPQKATLSHNDISNHYEIAMQRFRQANVKSAYMDFAVLIRHIIPNDYTYMKLADELSEIGLFTLSDEAINKVSDKEISFTQSEDVKKFYFPKIVPAKEDEIYLAEIYSNIMYNAQSKEATAELIKNNDLLTKYDYANYVAALGSLKTGNLQNADMYINNALKMNPDNINYQKLKIEIVLQEDKPKEASKILENIKKTKFNTTEFQNRITTLEYYTAYKCEKNDSLKKYYLGAYYHSIGEELKAVRTLQMGVSNKKKSNKLIYGLLAATYYSQKEYEKAQNFAEKAVQLGGNDYNAVITLGKINYRNGNYKEALKFFKMLNSDNQAMVWTAMAYNALGNSKQAKDIYLKILKDSSNCPEAYYNIAIMDNDRTVEYLKKSVAINLNYIDGWLELARNKLTLNNITEASKYLDIVKNIDENDFRYYYYQGLVFKAKGLQQEANYYFAKSHAINPDYELAKKELGI